MAQKEWRKLKKKKKPLGNLWKNKADTRKNSQTEYPFHIL